MGWGFFVSFFFINKFIYGFFSKLHFFYKNVIMYAFYYYPAFYFVVYTIFWGNNQNKQTSKNKQTATKKANHKQKQQMKK